ncbi:MAG: hypothetical protein ABI806_15035 [Candidatus Solibacter sp.]
MNSPFLNTPAVVVAALLFSGVTAMSGANLSAAAVVLVNSTAPDYAKFADTMEPHLRPFGVAYEFLDPMIKTPVAR